MYQQYKATASKAQIDLQDKQMKHPEEGSYAGIKEILDKDQKELEEDLDEVSQIVSKQLFQAETTTL